MSTGQSIVDAVQAATATLAASGVETARLDAEVLIRHLVGWDRTAYFLHRDESMPSSLAGRYTELIDRRAGGQPTAYLTGVREFMGLTFTVSPAVLVPRPETELLVEWALTRLNLQPRRVVLDLGTGSGAIILSVASRLSPGRHDRLVGSDVSVKALAVASQNQIQLASQRAVTAVYWVRGDLGRWSRPVDLVLANLPYLTPDQLAGNADLAAEPALALVAGHDGLDLIRQLIADLPRLLAPGGAAGLECDPSQAPAVVSLMAAALSDAEVTVHRDLAGLDRHVTAERRT